MAVIATCGPGVSVTGEVLHVPEWNPGVQGSGDRPVAKQVGMDLTVEASSSS